MARLIGYIKQAAAKLNIITTILGDLQGPKFRTGEQETEVIELKPGASTMSLSCLSALVRRRAMQVGRSSWLTPQEDQKGEL